MSRELTPEREEQVVRYLHGELEGEERARFEQEVLKDPDLAEALYVQQDVAEWTRAAEARSPVRRVVAARPPWFSRRPWVLSAAAAVVVAAVGISVLLQRQGFDRDERFRAPVGSLLIEPRGALAAAPTLFRWKAVPGAASYRFELTDAGSDRRFRTIVADTLFVLGQAPEAGPAPARGSWRVVPLAANGAELPAPPPVYFEVR